MYWDKKEEEIPLCVGWVAELQGIILFRVVVKGCVSFRESKKWESMFKEVFGPWNSQITNVHALKMNVLVTFKLLTYFYSGLFGHFCTLCNAWHGKNDLLKLNWQLQPVDTLDIWVKLTLTTVFTCWANLTIVVEAEAAVALIAACGVPALGWWVAGMRAELALVLIYAYGGAI